MFYVSNSIKNKQVLPVINSNVVIHKKNCPKATIKNQLKDHVKNLKQVYAHTTSSRLESKKLIEVEIDSRADYYCAQYCEKRRD
jgi:hypothetical protein